MKSSIEQAIEYGAVSGNEYDTRILAAKVNDFGSAAMDFSRDKLISLKKYCEEGNWTWRVGGFISGIIMMAVGLLNFFSHILSLAPFTSVLDVYIIFAGVISVILEFKDRMLTQKYIKVLDTEAKFLMRPYGRAAFYFFIGILLACTGGVLGFFGGLFIAIIGVIIYRGSVSAYSSLNLLKREHCSTEAIKSKFYEYDKDRSGFLETHELSALCLSLGTQLSRNELESALFILDKNGDGKIDILEFLEWWGVNDDLNQII